MRRLLLATLLVGYVATFVHVQPPGSARREFDPLSAAGRDVERAIEQGRYAQALSQTQALASRHQDDATVQVWLAEAYKGLGKPEDEARAWERVLAITKLADAGCPALPQANTRAGNRAAALDAYRRCADLAPDDPERWFDLAGAALAAGDQAEADAAFAKSRTLDPTNPRLPRDGRTAAVGSTR